MTLLVDDQLLSVLLRGEELPALWARTSPSPRLDIGTSASAVLELPEEIGLVSRRELRPVIGRLRARHQLNILGVEALPAAVYLNATVAPPARSPRLEDALSLERMPFRVVASLP